MAYQIKRPEIGDTRVLKVTLSSISGNVLEKGDVVTIIGQTERGWDLKEEDSGIILYECGWDIFL